MKKTIPLFLTGLAGTLVAVAYFSPRLVALRTSFLEWFEILAAFAFVLGGANLFSHHYRVIAKREAGWAYSAIILTSFVVTLGVGLLKVGVLPAAQHPELVWSGKFDESGSALGWIYEFVLGPLNATIFSLLGFYVASASFRAFRAKNFESSLLLGSAMIVLLGRTYAGTWLTAWMPAAYSDFTIPGLTVVIMAVFNTAGQRALMLGVALGVVATSLRVILGLDRSHLGSDGE